MIVNRHLSGAVAMACVAVCSASAADDTEIAQIIFSDDFERGDIAPWISNYVPQQFTIIDGVLHGTQRNPNHSAVIKTPVLFDNARISVDAKFTGARGFVINLGDDTSKNVVHSGHTVRVRVNPRAIMLSDDREGRYKLENRALRDDKAAFDAAIAGSFVNARLTQPLQEGRWYRVTLTVDGDVARVLIDGEQIAELQSPGIAHPRKDRLGLYVAGEGMQFDNVEVTRLP